MRCCHNLDWIITVIKNLLDYRWLHCSTNANFKDYIIVEVVLIENNYELIEESNYFKKLKVQND